MKIDGRNKSDVNLLDRRQFRSVAESWLATVNARVGGRLADRFSHDHQHIGIGLVPTLGGLMEPLFD